VSLTEIFCKMSVAPPAAARNVSTRNTIDGVEFLRSLQEVGRQTRTEQADAEAGPDISARKLLPCVILLVPSELAWCEAEVGGKVCKLNNLYP
jgi:hypothetical protein